MIQDLPYVGVKKYSRISEDDWKGYMGKIKKVLNAHFKGVHLVYGKAGKFLWYFTLNVLTLNLKCENNSLKAHTVYTYMHTYVML